MCESLQVHSMKNDNHSIEEFLVHQDFSDIFIDLFSWSESLVNHEGPVKLFMGLADGVRITWDDHEILEVMRVDTTTLLDLACLLIAFLGVLLNQPADLISCCEEWSSQEEVHSIRETIHASLLSTIIREEHLSQVHLIFDLHKVLLALFKLPPRIFNAFLTRIERSFDLKVTFMIKIRVFHVTRMSSNE